MNESIISVRYTKAIFSLGTEKGVIDAIKADMEEIFAIMNESLELQSLFQNPVLKPSKKAELAKQLFGSFHPLTLSFIQLLIENRREEYLHSISRNFLDKYKKYKGVETGILTTAIKVPDSTLERIKTLINNSLKTNVELSNNVDDSIIGGLILQIGDRQFDASVKNSLGKIKRRLLNTSIS